MHHFIPLRHTNKNIYVLVAVPIFCLFVFNLILVLSPGVNPQNVRGTKTGVFIGCSASESHEVWTIDMDKIVGYEMTGCTRSMFANRVSFFFDFKGQLSKDVHYCSHNQLKM